MLRPWYMKVLWTICTVPLLNSLLVLPDRFLQWWDRLTHQKQFYPASTQNLNNEENIVKGVELAVAWCLMWLNSTPLIPCVITAHFKSNLFGNCNWSHNFSVLKQLGARPPNFFSYIDKLGKFLFLLETDEGGRAYFALAWDWVF